MATRAALFFPKEGYMELADFYPVCIMSGIPAGNSVEFLHPLGKIAFEAPPPAAKIWAILDMCNGSNSAEEICDLVGFDTVEAADILSKLCEGGVLVDKNQLWRHLHAVTTNPAPYPQEPHSRSARRTGFTPVILTESEVQQLLHFTTDSPPAIQLVIFSLNDSLQGPGLYRLDSKRLVVKNTYDEVALRRLAFALDSDTTLYGASLAIVFSIEPQSNHGYRQQLLTAGRLVEQLDAQVRIMGLSTIEHTSFNDNALQALLGQETRAIPIVVVGIGKQSPLHAGSRIEQEFKLLRTNLVGTELPIERLWVASGDGSNPEEQRYSVFATAQADRVTRDVQSRTSMGTGSSTAHAGIKAIAEGIERIACSRPYWDAEGPASSLVYSWVDPRIIAPYTPSQLQSQGVARFDPEANHKWVLGREVSTNRPVYVPASLVFYRHIKPHVSKATSSGVAADMTASGAARRATLELLERDAIMRHWLQGKAPGRVMHYALDKQHLDKVRHWHGQGRRARVLDLSHDGIAIVVVMIHSDQYPCLVTGSAASDESFDAAVNKAFDEAELALRFALWAEPVAKQDPQQVRQPLDHGTLYYYPDYIDEVSWFWQGPFVAAPRAIQPVENLLDELNLVAVSFRGELVPLRVVRVISPQLLPVTFGWDNDHRSHHSLPQWVRERTPFPHFLA